MVLAQALRTERLGPAHCLTLLAGPMSKARGSVRLINLAASAKLLLAVLVSSRLRVVGPRHASGTRQLPSKPGRPLDSSFYHASPSWTFPTFAAVFAAPGAQLGKPCRVIFPLRFQFRFAVPNSLTANHL